MRSGTAPDLLPSALDGPAGFIGTRRAQGVKHVGDRHDVRAARAVEFIHERLVLEEVRIDAFLGQLHVGLHVVGEDLDLEIDALLEDSEGRTFSYQWVPPSASDALNAEVIELTRKKVMA